jgi:CheY-like chemotaxis protein
MSKRILVVEDQPDNRQIIRDMLAPTDYEITEVESGEEALAAIARQQPDLILMDIQYRLWTAIPPRAESRPTPHCDQSRLSRLRLTRLAARRRRRARRAAMIMFRSPSAHVNCWRKFDNTCPSAALFAALHESAFGTKQTSSSLSAMSAFGGKADIEISGRDVCF